MSPTALRALADQPISEALLVEVWARQWLDGRPLVDSGGRELRVVYPGRRWGGPGPDFQGAVLALADGTLLRGDVEVHRRTADWYSHGHHLDRAYNRVILHVVLQSGGTDGVRRQDGQSALTLALSGRLVAPPTVLRTRLDLSTSVEPGPACLTSVADLERLVEQAALERFFEKAASFEADLAALEPDEVLHRGLLLALGYSANKEPCTRLAELVPWSLVRRVGAEPDGERKLRALLLGAAGLLPHQRGLPTEPGEPAALVEAWGALEPELGRAPLGALAWRLGGVRPENWPTRRLVGGAVLLTGWAGREATAELFELLLAHRARPGPLIEAFRARSEADYWRWQYDFGAPSARPRPWQIGRPRAFEIVVNVLLPLAYAAGRSDLGDELAATALLTYLALPAGPWYRPTLAMAAQLFGPAGRRLCQTAARQQGLLHLFKRWCWERRCERCPAGANVSPVPRG